MIVRLFDIQNGKAVPTEHCYTLKFLKDIMEDYPDTYMQVYQYLFYMTCPNPDLNPFFNLPEHEKEDIIIEEIELEESTEDSKLAKYMETTQIEHGRDGNINSMVNAAAKFEQIRQSYKGAFTDMKSEQESSVRGGQGLAYDQM